MGGGGGGFEQMGNPDWGYSGKGTKMEGNEGGGEGDLGTK